MENLNKEYFKEDFVLIKCIYYNKEVRCYDKICPTIFYSNCDWKGNIELNWIDYIKYKNNKK